MSMSKKIPQPIVVVACILLFALLAGIQKYSLGTGDLATYLPFVLHEHDPSLFQGDLLIETIPDHPVYIWRAAAVFLRWFTPEQVFLALFWLQTILITAAGYFFYRSVIGRNMGWIVFLLMLVISHSAPAMGRYGLNPYGYFHPGAVGLGFLMIAYGFFARGNLIASGILTGTIFLFHPFSAIAGSTLYVTTVILRRKEIPLKKAAIGFLLLVAIASPSWVPHFLHLLRPRHDAFDKELWLAVVRMRMSFSFFISRWVPDRFIHLAVAITIVLLNRKQSWFTKVWPLAATTGVLCLLFALAELLSSKFLLQLQLARCSYLGFIAASVAIAGRIGDASESKVSWKTALWIAGGLFMAFYPMAERDHGWLRWLLIAALILFPTLTFALGLRKWKPAFVGVAMVLLLTGVTTNVLNFYRASGHLYDRTKDSWYDVQVWCRDNIPLNETILTPVYYEAFRSFSHHAIYGSWKDGAPHNYSKKTFERWWQRMEEFGIQVGMARREFPHLFYKNAISVARKHDINWIVAECSMIQANGSPHYRNSRFAVFYLDDESDASTQSAALFHVK